MKLLNKLIADLKVVKEGESSLLAPLGAGIGELLGTAPLGGELCEVLLGGVLVVVLVFSAGGLRGVVKIISGGGTITEA